MKQVCLLCERTSPDRNLYCQETYCPAEMSPTILGYGQWLGDIEIVKAVNILRSSVLYEAMHQKKKVLLKVAHPGPENTNRLKREAEFLKSMRVKKEENSYFPNWLPPYANTPVNTDADAYGRAMLGGHLLYFYLADHFPGEPLRDVLTKNPQLWINHIGWFMINVASAVAVLQSKGILHCGLSPDSVLVHFNNKPNIPQILLFDLGIVCDRKALEAEWYAFFVPPAYTAPELLKPDLQNTGYHTDVYGLGLILYELLVGEPCVPFKLRSDDEVYSAVRTNQRIRMNRTEDVKAVADIAIQAVNQTNATRHPNAAELVKELMSNFSEAPSLRRSWVPSLNTFLLIVVALLTIAFLITFVITLNQITV